MRNIHRNQRGDTIVEVLIAIAVVSSVLAITYSIMNRNLQTMRDNQERTEAAKLAQGQLEGLRAKWGEVAGKTAIEGKAADGFCINSDFDADDDVDDGLPDLRSGAPAVEMTDDTFAGETPDYPAECISSFYHIGIKRQGANTYQVTVRWDSLNGNRSQVVLSYIME